MEKIDKKTTIETIYGVLYARYKQIYEKLEKMNLNYGIKSDKDMNKPDKPVKHFILTKGKKVIKSQGIHFGTMRDNVFYWDATIKTMIKDVFIKFATDYKIDKQIIEVLIESLFVDNVNESINDKTIEIIPYVVSLIYMHTNANVVRMTTSATSDDAHYFLLMNFPLKISKKDITTFNTSISMLNMIKLYGTF